MASEEDKWSNAMKKILPQAELHLDVRPILTTLDSENLLNAYEYQEVDAETNKIEKTRLVFKYVRAKGPKYMKKFVEILDRPGTERWANEIRAIVGAPKEVTNEDPETLQGGEEPHNRLEEKPSQKEVLNVIVPKVAAKWDTLGIQLGLEDEVEQIGKDKNTVRERCFHVIKDWMEGRRRKPITWEVLLDAVKKEGYADFADEIREKLEKGKQLDN